MVLKFCDVIANMADLLLLPLPEGFQLLCICCIRLNLLSWLELLKLLCCKLRVRGCESSVWILPGYLKKGD